MQLAQLSLESELERTETAQRAADAEHKAAGQVIMLSMLDADHFKACNDTHGHQASDQVLRAVLQATKRSGFTARYGGEKFAVITPPANP